MSRVQKLFSDDSGISQFSARMRHIIIVNIMWVICCIPVFTVGAATAAAYESLRYTDKADRIKSGKMFTWAFRKYFKRATMLWAVLAIMMAPFFIIWLLLEGKESINQMLAALILLLLFLFYVMLSICFQVLIRSNGSAGEVLLFSFLSGMRYLLPYTLPVMVLSALPVLMFVFATYWFFKLILLWLVYGLAFIMYINLLIMKKPFKELAKLGDFILPEGTDLPPEVISGIQL